MPPAWHAASHPHSHQDPPPWHASRAGGHRYPYAAAVCHRYPWAAVCHPCAHRNPACRPADRDTDATRHPVPTWPAL